MIWFNNVGLREERKIFFTTNKGDKHKNNMGMHGTHSNNNSLDSLGNNLDSHKNRDTLILIPLNLFLLPSEEYQHFRKPLALDLLEMEQKLALGQELLRWLQ